MRGMKYIVYDTGMQTMIVTFPASMEHYMMAQALHVTKEHLISAGFVALDHDGKPYCHGDSHSLGLKSRGDADLKLLRLYMR